MAKKKLKVLGAVPGSTTFAPIVKVFCRNGGGIVTAFSDRFLPMEHRFVDEDAAEVKAFPDVVRQFLTMSGERALPLAQASHIEVAIADACGDLPTDSPFYRGRKFTGLHQAIASTLNDLHAWEIDAEELRRVAGLVSPRLAEKLLTLAQIDDAISAVLNTLGCQRHSEHLRACLESTPELDGGNSRLLVHVGSEFSPLRIKWLRWLAKHGVDVTVVVERHASGDTLFGGTIFNGARRTIDALGVPATPAGDGNLLMNNLFARDLREGPPIDVAIVSTADSFAEAEWAIRDCMDEERAGIYVRSLETYAPLLETAAKQFGATLQIARRVPLLTNSFARLTLAALEFCASNDVRTLNVLLKSSYLGLTGEQQNQIASGLREAHRTRGAQWDELNAWAASDGAAFPWIALLLEWRRKANSSYELPEWKELITQLIQVDTEFPWSTKIMGRDPHMSDRDRRAKNQLERKLTGFITVKRHLDPRSYSLAEITDICRKIWQDADVSIPSTESGITVADDPYLLSDVDTLRVMGMLEGVFPRRRTEEPVLADFERAEISACRPEHPPLPTSHDRAEAERDMFYRVCATAKRKIVFSYPLADDSRDNIPAFYLTEVERAVGDLAESDRPKVVKRQDFARNLYAPLSDECEIERDIELREALDGPRTLPLGVALDTAAAREALRTPEEHEFDPRELRDALECPFRYTVRHRLHLRVKRPTARWQALQKLPQASGLLSKPDEASAEGALIMALESELDRLYSEIPDWELQLLRSGGRRMIREWMRREFSSRATWPKHDMRTNVAYGDVGLRQDIAKDVRLGGMPIPAISRHQGYKVAHLYGSGLRDPKNPLEAEKLFFGVQFLSLFEPGMESALEIESMRGKRDLIVLTRSGGQLINQQAEGLSVIDLSTHDDPVQSKRAFFDDVKKALRKTMARISEVSVEPLRGDHCDWCDFGELCRRSRAFGETDSPFGDDVTGGDV